MSAASASPNAPAQKWDVVIIGGGPAGSTAATTLAMAGRRVLLLEKERFPRFHIGESLLPYNRRVFDDLGVWSKIAAAGFMRKRAAQFLMGSGSHKVRLDFSKGSFTEYSESIQVERAKFDHLLLNHARECGAEIHEECLVLSHRVGENEVGIRYRAADEVEHEVRADFLMDASGLSNFTANCESIRRFYPGHKKVAIFGHFANLDMPQGDEKGDILIVRRENSWFWMIPLEDNKTSVGLVLDRGDFQALGKDLSQIYFEFVRATPVVSERFTRAEALNALNVVSDFSYRNDRLVAPRIVRVGDASGFIDPIFSSGVLLAMTSGQHGARAVHEALSAGALMTAALRAYEKATRQRIGLYWEFIENFYKPHFAQIFFQPDNRFQMVCVINAVLAGCTNLPFAAWWRLRGFFFLVWLNKWIPVMERIRIS